MEQKQENKIDLSQIKIKAIIPHNLISGISSFGTIQHATLRSIKKINKKDIHAIELIECGFRTRTTRSKKAFSELSNLKIGDYIINYRRNSKTRKIDIQLLCQITDIYDDTNIKFTKNWYKEGWTEGGKKC